MIYFGSAKQKVTHFFHRVFPVRFVGRKEPTKKVDELSLAYLILSQILYITFRPIHGFYAALWSLNIAETLGPSAQLGKNYAYLGYIFSLMKKKRAMKYFNQATNIAKELRDPSCTMMVQEYLGIYYHGTCEWTKSLKAYSKLLKWSLKYGSRRFLLPLSL